MIQGYGGRSLQQDNKCRDDRDPVSRKLSIAALMIQIAGYSALQADAEITTGG